MKWDSPPETQSAVDVPAGPRRFDPVIGVISVILLLLLIVVGVLVWRVGLFDERTQASNGQVIAASLALVGVLVTASLTFIGVLLKHSVDARTLQQAAETEGRLRLETSISAVQLLTEDGKPAMQTRQAGALFVLINLNQLDFAYALLGQMWPSGHVSPGAASWVVNRLLLDGGPRLQDAASDLILANAEKLASPPESTHFPSCVALSWKNDLPMSAREVLVSAYVRMMLAADLSAWDDSMIGEFVAQLHIIQTTEEESYICKGAATCLDALFDVREMNWVDISTERGAFLLSEVKSETARCLKLSPDLIVTEHERLADRLREEWGSASAGADTYLD